MNFKNNIIWLYFSTPKHFFPLAGKLIPVFTVAAVIACLIGLYLSFFVAPTDYQQGDSYRILFIHVGAAWMSMFIYVIMALYAIINLVWNIKTADVMAASLAPTGAIATFAALWTGAFWGKPTWGTYWIWDARLTSELILLFLYIGYMALRSSIDDPRRSSRASALLAIVGVVNIPIIYFSVKWWNTLHQGSSMENGIKMEGSMVAAMLVMMLAYWMYAIAIALYRARATLLEREKDTQWVQEYIEQLEKS